MIALAIDTSSRQRCVVALASEAGELIHSEVREGVTTTQGLPQSLAALQARLAAIDVVVAVVGPGSYTGIRAGMAAAVGVAQASHLPLHGTGALDVIAAGIPRDAGNGGRSHVWAVADAGRDAVYLAKCEREETVWIAGSVQRKDITGVHLDAPAASADPLALPGLIRIDPAAALARAVPGALLSDALAFTGLRGVYIG